MSGEQPTPPADRTAEIERCRRLPKIELHLHLEGAIPLACLWELTEKYGGDPGVPDRDALAARFRYRDFAGFIDTWCWKNGFLRSYDDFRVIAAAVARELAAQRVLYAEVFHSPQSFACHGLSAPEITRAVRRGFAEVPEIEIALVLDLVRDLGPAAGLRVLAEVAEVRREAGVIGIGLGGSEHRFPPAPFAPVYALARRLGLRTTAHAGEACGPASVWEALRTLQVERIGHGTRAGEDPALVAHLAEKRIPLEVAVVSNLRTGIVPSAEEHPLRRFVEQGIPVSINTDDPTLFNTTLADEYLVLHERMGYGFEEIGELIVASAGTAWLDEARCAQLQARLRAAMGAFDRG